MKTVEKKHGINTGKITELLVPAIYSPQTIAILSVLSYRYL
jgi:hypothetical protein